MRSPSLSAALLALAVAFAVPALAAPEDNRIPPNQQSLDDGELSDFVAAFVRLIGVQHGYMMLMRQEDDPSRLEDMKNSAVTDMTAAVEQDGLTVDRYNQIAVAVRDDPGLQGRVEAILQQLAADPSAAPDSEGE